MRQTRPDDALVGLVSSIIHQAMLDFQLLQKNGVLDADGEVVGILGRIKTKKVRMYRVLDGMGDMREVMDLVSFLKGWGLDLLCDFTGIPACRIRRKLDIKKLEVL